MTDVRAELTASVFKVEVAVGDEVEEGQPLVILESMKMEIPVISTRAGRVEELLFSEGDIVEEGAVVARLAD
ncbi:biotin/lipoyl-binding carrier protein [Aeromicrobium tamlense]|uniref:Acetyl-CoA carboxylase biotin carboxyl carrier protein n=1 Tax=Aeromicrobium tamlense TaxID=375541 RepID=A0A8I0FUR0_9ACTN|nr:MULTISPECIES: biotin/lipoyl-binding carrier protein [Aeromicrobium]MBD1269221.1 biotin/lipoyl-binding carrier protein [Aeromicrobium tamlense]NYI36870.1 acetyl-CoA carboxylase biotin carboxyl carrier protein [Aeromicrobium tamlense]